MASIHILNTNAKKARGIIKHNSKDEREKNEHSNADLDTTKTHENINFFGGTFSDRVKRFDSIRKLKKTSGKNEALCINTPIIPELKSEAEQLKYLNEYIAIVDKALLVNLVRANTELVYQRAFEKYKQDNNLDISRTKKIWKTDEDGNVMRDSKNRKIELERVETDEYIDFKLGYELTSEELNKISKRSTLDLSLSKVSIDLHADEVHEIVDEHTNVMRDSFTHIHDVRCPIVNGQYNFKLFADVNFIQTVDRQLTELNNKYYGTYFSFKYDENEKLHELSFSNDGKTVEQMKANQEKVMEIYIKEKLAKEKLENAGKSESIAKAKISEIESDIADKVVIKQNIDSEIEQLNVRLEDSKVEINEQVTKWRNNKSIIQKQIEEHASNKEIIKTQNEQVRRNEQVLQQQANAVVDLDERERELEERERKLLSREQKIEKLNRDIYIQANEILDGLDNKVAKANAIHALNAVAGSSIDKISSIDLSL